ncbi:hypothetical protein BGZ94_009550 [Podila epigama]|nr:hypothetical protein BGZ94_009550 [Podila epigama]
MDNSQDTSNDTLELTLEKAESTINDAIERIDRNAGVKGGKATVVRAVATMEHSVQTFGLAPEQVVSLLEVILASKIDDATARKLVKLLLPRQRVPEDCAIRILGCLGKHISFSIQALLLRWIILVYDLFDGRSRFQRLYGVVFHYLSYETLRLDLQVTVGKEPALTGLLHIYKTYFPDLILTPLQLSNSTIFKCPDQATATMISQIQDRWQLLNASIERDSTFGGSKDPIERIGNKRQKISHIPDALSVYRRGHDDHSIPVSQITSIGSLVQHIDTLTLPDQLASIFSSRVLQHVVCLQTSNSIVERISYWLGQELMNLWYWSEKTEASRARFGHILSKVVEVTTMVKSELILCYSRLLARWAQFRWGEYLKLGMGPHLPAGGIEDLRRLFSELSPTVDYMEALRAFILHVDRLSVTALEVENDHVVVQHGVLSFFDVASTLTETYHLPLAVVVPDAAIVYRSFLSNSSMAVSRICGIVYEYKRAFEKFEQELQNQYDEIVQAMIESKIAVGENIDADNVALPQVKGYNRDYVVHFNSYVMDLCNFLWRIRAFNKTDKNSRGFVVEDTVIAYVKEVCVENGLSMSGLFSITHSPALSGFSSQFLKSLEDKENISSENRIDSPPSAASLKSVGARGGLAMTFDEYRIEYLDSLESSGLKGLCQFLLDCIANLSQRRVQMLEERKQKEKSTKKELVLGDGLTGVSEDKTGGLPEPSENTGVERN